MKIGYEQFKTMLTSGGDLPGLMRFRMMFPDTYTRFYEAYMEEMGKPIDVKGKSKGERRKTVKNRRV